MATKKTSKPPSDTVAASDAEDTLPAAASDDTPPAGEGMDAIALPEPGRETDAEPVAIEDPAAGPADPDAPVADPAAPETTVEGPETPESETVSADDDTLADAPRPQDFPSEEPPNEGAAADPAPEHPAPVVVEKRGGFVPLALGGMVAAAIGFFAALGLGGSIPGVGPGAGLSDRVAAQDQAIADLKAALPAAPDLAPLETAAADNATAIASLSDRIAAVETGLADLGARIADSQKAMLENGVSDTAIQAYEDELARLQDAMRQQREEVEAMVASAQTMQADAETRSAETEARAALTQILSALDSGDGYAEPLDLLQSTGQQVPEPLVANVEGVPTLSELRDSFPPAARNALAVTRGAGNSSVGDFFKTQLGIRSLAPREGDDPDAVLSRAEAALARGDIAAAQQEIETLPEPARAELADWTAAAETRRTTVAAANGLMAELNN